MDRKRAVTFLLNQPYKLGHLVGFNDLNEMHNRWIVDMVSGRGDRTLQAHRGSYKTTCVSIALSIICVLFPREKTAFFRKTDSDIKEVIRQVQNILTSPQLRYIIREIYGVDLLLTESSQTALTTNLVNDNKGMSQLSGIGTQSSLTGKHYDRIFTDDIVNLKDRLSRAERERTKAIYMEIVNLINRGGRIYNTGTPWHKDDCFQLMPSAERWDCYKTGLIGPEQLAKIQRSMSPALFSANYELKHIPDEDVLFTSPKTGFDPALAEQGLCHIDAAYGGADYNAFTICNRKDGKYYVFGKLFHGNVDQFEDTFIELRKQFNAGRIYNEDNADKGFLARDLRKKGERVTLYHENMNKHYKITSYLRAIWDDVRFVEGTDEAYIDQICDYNENAEHDDAPDSLASLARVYSRRSEQEYKPLWN